MIALESLKEELLRKKNPKPTAVHLKTGKNTCF